MICRTEVTTDNFDDGPLEFSGERRYVQSLRVLTLAELLRQFRFGITLAYIVAEIYERTGESWCERTIRRDLQFLRSANLVEEIPNDSGSRWKWTEQRPLIAVSPDRFS